MEDQKKDWAEMSDGEEPETVPEEEKAKITVKKRNPKPVKGFKNAGGDYIVTTINVVDTRSGVKAEEDKAQESESDSDDVYDDEDDSKEEAKQAKQESKEGKLF